MHITLDDKVAIITGGARGIGKATVSAFLDSGARVVVADYDGEAGQQLVSELGNSSKAIFVKVDVTDTDQVENMVQKAVETFGRLDILVNNAGVTADGFLTKLDDTAWERVLAVNLTGVYKCSKAGARIMLIQGSGVILNASSVVGLYGNIGQVNYVATKAGVIGMTKTLAKELGSKGIRVNAVAPGFIATDMTAKVPEKVIETMKVKTPLHRMGSPEDIANAYLFLASDAASFINGAVLSVDGGIVV